MSEIYIIQNTGINGGNYKYWSSKSACDSWFKKKAKHTLTDYSYIRADQTTKTAYSPAAVHVNLSYSDVEDCDYLSFDNGERLYHAQIVTREYVNEKSTRLWFVVDYVATFWDTIEIGQSFIERTHVTDDSSGGFTASEYLLPEPVAANLFVRSDAFLANPFYGINDELQPDSADLCLITTVSPDGAINDPEIRFQSGGAIAGYITVGDESHIQEQLKTYVTYSTSLINRKDTILNYLNNIYYCPSAISTDFSKEPTVSAGNISIFEIVNIAGIYKPKHAKVYDYIRVRFFTLNGSVTFSPAEFKQNINYTVHKIGGPDGRYEFEFWNGAMNRLSMLASPAWPAVGVTATQKQHDYGFDTVTSGWESLKGFISSEWDAKEERKRLYNMNNGGG